MFLSKKVVSTKYCCTKANGNCVHDSTSVEKLVILPIKVMVGSAKRRNATKESLKRKRELLVFFA